MAMPDVTLRGLLEAGVHFGHHTRRWNPKMAPYIFGVRNQVHILDLQQTVPLMERALRAVRDTVASGGRVLFVGTKKAAADYVAEAATRCGQYYVNHRWLGGMLTNWKTISQSIRRLRELEAQTAEQAAGRTKKELLDLQRERDKLERALGGIKDMGGLPDVLFVVDTLKEAIAIQEAARLGIAILPPDINRSGAEFLVEPDKDGRPAIRFALAAVKRVGLKAMQDLVAARGAPFTSLADFAARVDPKLLNKMQVENLARAGAFDSLDRNRARVFHGAETILRRAQATAEDRASSQIGLFGATAGPEPLRLPDMPDWPELERLAQEAEAVGFHLSAHPLDAYKAALKRLGVTPSSAIAERARAGAARLKLAGTVVNSKERNTRTGSRMAWVTLSDGAGSFEVTFFSETLSRCRDILTEGSALLVTADARIEGETLRLTAQDAEPLDRAAADLGQELRIGLDSAEAVPAIRDLLASLAPGRGRIVLLPKLAPGQEVEIVLPRRVAVAPRLAQALKAIPGVASVEAA
jgi:ribosomal protein S2